MVWEVHNMCKTVDQESHHFIAYEWYCDEDTWRSSTLSGRDMGGGRVPKDGGVSMVVKWARMNRANEGTTGKPEISCRLVAHELECGEEMGERFAGTPSARRQDAAAQVVQECGPTRCDCLGHEVCGPMGAFEEGLSSIIRPRSKGQRDAPARYFVKAMCWTRGAQQVWSGEIRKTCVILRNRRWVLHPSAFCTT